MSKATERPLSEGADSPAAGPVDLAELWSLQPPQPPVLHDVAAALDVLPIEERFQALCRLAEVESIFQRMAAYRWLADMHRIDLRYETRAKRELRKALDRECGLARARVERLMKLC